MSAAEPLDAFMRRALFDPVHGYYSRKISVVGARGDFSTSASASDLLGKAIAQWLLTASKEQPEVRTIIEVGGGGGSLMACVRKQIGWIKRRRFDFYMVETSAPLREQQQKRLRSHVQWFDHLSEALDSCAGAAFIYHNELLDALPVALVEWNDGSKSWKGVYVETRSAALAKEEYRDPAEDGKLAGFHSLLREWNANRPPPHARQRCELHVGIRGWLDEWAAHWKSGAMLSIDYGDLFPALYHRRPHGTLRAYLLHQRLEGAAIYQNVGRQDITADVNFTDLRDWLTEIGCDEVFYSTQRDFVVGQLGPRARSKSAADQFVLNADGAGSAFKCLAVRRPAR